jgi:hypothetical protein
MPSTASGGRPWQAAVQASITRVDLDVVESVEYRNGVFTRRNRVVGGLRSQAVVELDGQTRRQLLSELQTELIAPPPETDVDALTVFVDLLQTSLKALPSHRFDTAHFGAITYDDSTGTVFGHLTLGVDVAATIHDHGHRLSFEQHPVTLPPGAYGSLSSADRASLVQALRARAPADPHWRQIQADAAG